MPSRCLRSSVTERRPRNITSYHRSRPNPKRASSTRSISNTSAPMSASIMLQNGAGPIASNSRTRMPARGPMRLMLLMLLASPRRRTTTRRLVRLRVTSRSDTAFGAVRTVQNRGRDDDRAVFFHRSHHHCILQNNRPRDGTRCALIASCIVAAPHQRRRSRCSRSSCAHSMPMRIR